MDGYLNHNQFLNRYILYETSLNVRYCNALHHYTGVLKRCCANIISTFILDCLIFFRSI